MLSVNSSLYTSRWLQTKSEAPPPAHFRAARQNLPISHGVLMALACLALSQIVTNDWDGHSYDQEQRFHPPQPHPNPVLSCSAAFPWQVQRNNSARKFGAGGGVVLGWCARQVLA